jgi:hypothetical protein
MTSTTSNSATSNRKLHVFRYSKVWTSRVLFLICLVGVAIILAFFVHLLLTESETSLATNQFASIADRALFSAQQIALRNRLGTITLASVASNAFPDAQTWPFVNISGYEEISTNLIRTSNGKAMGLCPLVLPDQLSKFEDFAYSEVIEPKFPPGTAVSSFG